MSSYSEITNVTLDGTALTFINKNSLWGISNISLQEILAHVGKEDTDAITEMDVIMFISHNIERWEKLW